MFLKRGPPMETGAHSRALVNIYWKVPRPPGSPHTVPSETDALFLDPSFINHLQSPVYDSPTDSKFPSEVQGPLWTEMPVSTALRWSFMVSGNATVPRALRSETPHS
jgi:hypothetical protein